jgi:lipopolysaccharide biosynthesis glycosyltransferase
VRILSYKYAENFKYQFINYSKAWLRILKKKFDIYRPAFNAGVLAFSTDIIHSCLLYDLRELLEEYRGFTRLDEETILNIYYYHSWKELPAIYNICPNYEMGYRGCKTSELV